VVAAGQNSRIEKPSKIFFAPSGKVLDSLKLLDIV